MQSCWQSENKVRMRKQKPRGYVRWLNETTGLLLFKNNFGMQESLVNPPTLGVGDSEFKSHHSDDDKCKKQ